MTHVKAAPWVGGTLALTMSLISAIPASAQQARPSQPFDRAYATDVAQGIERACRDINYEVTTTSLRTTQDIQNWQDGLQAKIYAHTRRMPADVAEGYAGGAEKYLSAFRERLLRNPNISQAAQGAAAACNEFTIAAKSAPTVERGGFRPPVQDGARVPKPKSW